MSRLHFPSPDPGLPGIFAQVTAAQAGWDFLNMAALRLARGQGYHAEVGEHENVTVILGGRCRITVGSLSYELGRRPDVFSGMPYAIYLPRRSRFAIEALSDSLEIASCWVPTHRDYPLQVVGPPDCAVEIRGGGNASRQINSILPPGFDCHRLVCVEVYTPSGNWSSYPPHKHDEHRQDEHGTVLEADMEEIYFYKLSDPRGFAYQRVYTGDGRLDELCLARNHDIVVVPEGYHPVVSGHGYTTYYLNFLAGSAQSLANSDDPTHAWVKAHWDQVDPRLPLVHVGMEAC
ncbi:5-deoxy-glucuronate isomerase [bacterium]|nr:5-deoxy-glucuronate isomerase [bacterium]